MKNNKGKLHVFFRIMGAIALVIAMLFVIGIAFSAAIQK